MPCLCTLPAGQMISLYFGEEWTPCSSYLRLKVGHADTSSVYRPNLGQETSEKDNNVFFIFSARFLIFGSLDVFVMCIIFVSVLKTCMTGMCVTTKHVT